MIAYRTNTAEDCSSAVVVILTAAKDRSIIIKECIAN